MALGGAKARNQAKEKWHDHQRPTKTWRQERADVKKVQKAFHKTNHFTMIRDDGGLSLLATSHQMDIFVTFHAGECQPRDRLL